MYGLTSNYHSWLSGFRRYNILTDMNMPLDAVELDETIMCARQMHGQIYDLINISLLTDNH